MIVAGRVISGARDRNPLFNRQKHGDLPALRFLSDYNRDLLGKIAARNPTLVSASLSIAFPLADFDAGAALPDTLEIPGGTVYFTQSDTRPAPLTVVDQRNKLNPRLALSAYREGSFIKFAGDAERWASVESVELEYVPTAQELAALDATLDVPDEAHLTCVAAVAMFFGSREGMDLSGPFDAAEGRLLEDIRRSKRAHRITRYMRR